MDLKWMPNGIQMEPTGAQLEPKWSSGGAMGPTGSQLDGLQDVLAQARQDREQKTEAANRATA